MKGSQGETIIAETLAIWRQNRGRAAERSSSKEMTEDVQSMHGPHGTSKARREPPWPEGADLETRIAYGRMLVGSYGLWLTISFS
jgi:hypothetical protein